VQRCQIYVFMCKLLKTLFFDKYVITYNNIVPIQNKIIKGKQKQKARK